MTTGDRIRRQVELGGHVEAFFIRSGLAVAAAGAEACDFLAGDPHDPPLAPYVEALRRHAPSERADWYAYTTSDPSAQEVVAKSLADRFGHTYAPEDIVMTNAAIAGLAVTLRVVCDPGDEVIILTPPHFLYPILIRAAGAEPVRVPLGERGALDLAAIEAAITERTRAIIVNSPHNPTGRIFTEEELGGLAEVLSRAPRPIAMLSDEAYNRILYDGRAFVSPTSVYPHSFLIYTYGKTLLSPGQRIGYVAIGPEIGDRDLLRQAFTTAQIEAGWAFPNALLQHALADLEGMSVDVARLERRRDAMVEGLRDLGYEVEAPEATFYLLPRSPIPDDEAFTESLWERNVFVMPGTLLEAPGTFRISLTANDDAIARSWDGFAAAIADARA